MENISPSAASQFRPHHSPWLHNTLAEVDGKFKTILNLVEDDDGETFAKRAEMYYQNKPQLLDLVQDLHKSYRALAENHDHYFSTHRVYNSTADKESPDLPARIIANNDDEEEEEDIKAAAEEDSGRRGGTEEAFWDWMKVLRENQSVLVSFMRKYEEQGAEIRRLKNENLFVRRLLDAERLEKEEKRRSSRSSGIPKFKKVLARLLLPSRKKNTE